MYTGIAIVPISFNTATSKRPPALLNRAVFLPPTPCLLWHGCRSSGADASAAAGLPTICWSLLCVQLWFSVMIFSDVGWLLHLTRMHHSILNCHEKWKQTKNDGVKRKKRNSILHLYFHINTFTRIVIFECIWTQLTTYVWKHKNLIIFKHFVSGWRQALHC